FLVALYKVRLIYLRVFWNTKLPIINSASTASRLPLVKIGYRDDSYGRNGIKSSTKQSQ
ncbi:unnamed protein product, partial [Callosobruchus maculatus]